MAIKSVEYWWSPVTNSSVTLALHPLSQVKEICFVSHRSERIVFGNCSHCLENSTNGLHSLWKKNVGLECLRGFNSLTNEKCRNSHFSLWKLPDIFGQNCSFCLNGAAQHAKSPVWVCIVVRLFQREKLFPTEETFFLLVTGCCSASFSPLLPMRMMHSLEPRRWTFCKIVLIWASGVL